MGDSFRHDEALPLFFDTPAVVASVASRHFEPAPGVSVEDLLVSPWRAHMAFWLPENVTLLPNVGVRFFDALEYRSPNPEYVDGALYLNFTVEDGGEWARHLLDDVERFVIDAIAGAVKVASEISYDEEARPPRLRLASSRRASRKIMNDRMTSV